MSETTVTGVTGVTGAVTGNGSNSNYWRDLAIEALLELAWWRQQDLEVSWRTRYRLLGGEAESPGPR